MLTVTVANLEWFTPKSKLVTYTRALVELYNKNYSEQVYEIYEMIELEKLYTLTLENLHNFSVYQIIEISLVLHNAYVVSRNYNKFMFYINNYID